jgi:hypothetical protein
VANPAEVFTPPWGRQYAFAKQGTLTARCQIGAELHSQYMPTYCPTWRPVFHTILVQVARPDLKIRTRDGYYLAGTPR